MIFYYIIFLLIFCSSLFNDKITKKAFFLFFLSIFFILSFIRWGCGTDWLAYKKIFDNALIPGYREKGFQLLNKIIRSYTDNYTVCLFFEAIIIYACIRKPLEEFSIFPMFSLLAFFCLNKANIFFVRQTISVSITMLSTFFLWKNKKILAIIFWFLAFLFHSAAIAYLPVFFIWNKNFSIRLTLFAIVLSIFIAIFMDKILNIMLGSNAALIKRFIRYAEEGDNTFGYGGGHSKIYLLVKSLISRSFLLVFLFILKRKRTINLDKKFNLIFNFYIFGFCIYIMITSLSFTLSRLTQYYTIMEIFCYPYFLHVTNKKYLKVILFFLLIVYLALRLYSGINGYYDCFVPLNTIFNPGDRIL